MDGQPLRRYAGERPAAWWHLGPVAHARQRLLRFESLGKGVAVLLEPAVDARVGLLDRERAERRGRSESALLCRDPRRPGCDRRLADRAIVMHHNDGGGLEGSPSKLAPPPSYGW